MPPAFAIAAATDRGHSRVRNEDAYVIDAGLGLLIVADGMGGHPAGDVASALAAEEVRRWLRTTEAASHGSDDPASRATPGERMFEAVRMADARVREDATAHPERAGMGTTLTALMTHSVEPRVVIGHVGDSRAYFMEGGQVRQLTSDHTWIQQQIDAGTMAPAQALRHRWAHVLTQAVGVGDEIHPDVLEIGTRTGQLYLLCTDGLTNMLTDQSIERTLDGTLSDGLDAAAWALVDAANDRGGIDNITVALLRID